MEDILLLMPAYNQELVPAISLLNHTLRSRCIGSIDLTKPLIETLRTDDIRGLIVYSATAQSRCAMIWECARSLVQGDGINKIGMVSCYTTIVWMVNMIKHHYPETWSMRNISRALANFIHYMWQYCVKYDDPRLVVQYELGIKHDDPRSVSSREYGAKTKNRILGMCRGAGNSNMYRMMLQQGMYVCLNPLEELGILACMYTTCTRRQSFIDMGKCLIVNHPHIVKSLPQVPREKRMCVLVFVQSCLSQLSTLKSLAVSM